MLIGRFDHLFNQESQDNSSSDYDEEETRESSNSPERDQDQDQRQNRRERGLELFFRNRQRLDWNASLVILKI